MSKRLKQMAIRHSPIALLLVAVVLAAISGCSSNTALALEAKDNGRQIELQKGQILVINLEANPSTGYTWEPVDLKGAIVRQVGETEFNPDSDLVGAPGTQTLRFEALKSGQMDLKLVYHRPWEEGVEPLETFTVQVTVQ
jgi:inhibitor of cysteine peptidase